MPDTEEVKKTVDIDTSGPAMDVDVPEEKDQAEIEQPELQQEEPNVRPVVDEKKSEDKTYENEREVKLDKKESKEEEIIVWLKAKWLVTVVKRGYHELGSVVSATFT